MMKKRLFAGVLVLFAAGLFLTCTKKSAGASGESSASAASPSPALIGIAMA
jgi:hypothetical protein